MAQLPRLHRTLPRSAALAAFLSFPLPGQCEPAFQPGELLGTPRGSTLAMQVYDPDGGGVAPDMLVLGHIAARRARSVRRP